MPLTAGLAQAREEGRLGGRPRRLDAKQEREVLRLVQRGDSQAHAARLFGVSTATVSRLMARA